MRSFAFIVAAVAAFFVWDGLANESAYRIALMKNLDQAATFPGMVKVSWN